MNHFEGKFFGLRDLISDVHLDVDKIVDLNGLELIS
jgi:hypothetical protein